MLDQYIVTIDWPNENNDMSAIVVKNNVPGCLRSKTLSPSESEWLYDVLENGYRKSLKKHLAEKMKRRKKNPLEMLEVAELLAHFK